MSVGATRCRVALPLGARALHRQRAPYPHSPLGPVVHCTAEEEEEEEEEEEGRTPDKQEQGQKK